LQAALDAAARAGGGTVMLPPGTFLTGAVFLRSNIHLHVSAGATLRASERFSDFPAIRASWEGVDQNVHASLLTGQDLENVVISGNGVLDGRGAPWWKAKEASPSALKLPRPRVINLVRCQGVVISGVMVHDGPSYNIHLVSCQDVIIDGVSVLSVPRYAQTTNSDGIVLDSCKQVRVSNCSLNTDSDNIALRAGKLTDGGQERRPCEDVLITNSTFGMSRWGGVNLGRDTAGSIRNVTISNCIVSDCRVGVRLKTMRGRGGTIEHLRVSNMLMERVARGIEILPYMDAKEGDSSAAPAADEGTPTMNDLSFSGLTMNDVQEVARIEGLAERFVRGVRINELSASRVKSGIFLRRVTDARLSAISIEALGEHAVAARDVERLEVHRLSCPQESTRAPLVHLENVRGAFVHGCDVAVGGSRFVRLQGERNHRVNITGNNHPAEWTAEASLRGRPG
jgi:polygalacturonase